MATPYRLILSAGVMLVILGTTANLPPLAASAASSTLHPVADAMVRSAYPDANYGKMQELRARYSPVVESYLRFSVSGLGTQAILNATLQVYATSSSARGLTVRPVSSNTWGETTITYKNAPPAGSILDTSSAVTAGSWVSMDVTSYVKAEGTYSFRLATDNADPIVLRSRESSNNTPRLVINGASTGPSSWQPSFPIRAAFYYPWFPEAWKQQGIYPYTNYTPELSYYSSTDSAILKKHLAMMQYAHIQAGIASWWGPGSQTDTKIAGLLQAASGTRFRWTLYYENESQADPSVTKIHNDLVYIRDHYGMDPSFLRVNGKFVVFVYSAGNDACAMANRWKKANTVGAYVVLKVFPGYGKCASQPDSWHQYSPAVADSQQGSISYSISPGFWLKGRNVKLQRSIPRWNQSVKSMVASHTRWQLITTFSEWGEGTAVEPASQWSSTSGYGQYLDALHNVPNP